ncbi:MAG: glycosyltransferase family 4 protein [Acidobacteria bacterium]|nr:glycosyltransferase family 4 protein [Acidobacteriota bacterium]MDW7984650.1 glycosyltransferase family 4 protein [Acidobacteriota bacterium]
MRILLVSGFGITPQRGGQGTFCAQLAVGLTHLGHEVWIATPDRPAWTAWASSIQSNSISIKSYSLNNFARADVIHVNNIVLRGIVGALVARKPLVITHQDYRAQCPSWTSYSPQGPCRLRPQQRGPCSNCLRKSWWLRYRLRLQVRLLARAENVGVSYHVRSRLGLAHAIWSPYDATQVPDLSRHPTEPRIAFIGRLVPEKGPHIVVQSLKYLKHIIIDIFGNGPMEDELRTEASKLGFRDRVHFHGHRLNPIGLARTAMAIVVPSLWDEPFGYVTVEAMAAGKSVIAAATGASVELLADERGWLVPPADPKALADAVRQVQADPSEAQRRGCRAREFVLTTLNPVKIAELYEKIYQLAALKS